MLLCFEYLAKGYVEDKLENAVKAVELFVFLLGIHALLIQRIVLDDDPSCYIMDPMLGQHLK
jgi:hypothetical protein